MTEYSPEELLEQTLQYRHRFYQGLGVVAEDEGVGSIVSTRFTNLPNWPAKLERYVRINTDDSVILVSDGLSDPFEGDTSNQGFELELLVESTDPIGNVMDSWQFQILRQLSLNIAADGNFREAFEAQNLSMSYDIQDVNVPENFKMDGAVGLILGIPSCYFPEFIRLPTGNARLITVKLLTEAEFKYILKHGAKRRDELVERLVAQGYESLSFLDRESVV